MRVESCLIIALLSTTAIAPASTQTAAEPDSTWRAALAGLTPGTTVRVHNRERGRIKGHVLSASGPTLTLDIGGTPTELSTAALDSLWVRGTAAKTGAIVGAIPGGLMGWIAHGVGNIDCEQQCRGAIPAVLVGATAGAIIGAVIGSLIPKWHRQGP